MTNFQLRTFLRRCSCADFFHGRVEYISGSLPAQYYGVQNPGGQDIRGDRNGSVTDVMVGDSKGNRKNLAYQPAGDPLIWAAYMPR